MKTILNILLTIITLVGCREEFHPISLPDPVISIPTSDTVSTSAPTGQGCPNQTFSQTLIGTWTYTSTYLINPNGGSTKNTGRITFKNNMTFEDPDHLFGTKLSNLPIISNEYIITDYTLRIYITNSRSEQLGVILILHTNQCNKLSFVNKGSNVLLELTK